MIAITSIAPNHRNNQLNAVNSWLNYGLRVVSLNHPDEIKELKDIYKGVEFIPTERTMQALFGKKYVAINALIDYAKGLNEEVYLFINSDIVIIDKHDIIKRAKEKSKEGVVYAKRHDYTEENNEVKKYEYGIDAFFIHKNYLNIFPQSIYCLGQTFWDYWVPYRAIKEGVKIFEVQEPFIYHKIHPFQYKMEDWKKIGKYFIWENDLERFNNVGKMSQYVYQLFTQKTEAW